MKGVPVDVAEGQGLARTDGDLPQLQAAELLHRRFDVVLFAHRDAPGGQHQVRLARALLEGGAGGLQAVLDDAEGHDFAAHGLEQAGGGEQVGVVDLARGQGLPGITNSSPVAKRATRGRRTTSSSATPTEAARPRCWGLSTAPAAMISLPRVMSSPVRRMLAPGFGTSWMRTPFARRLRRPPG